MAPHSGEICVKKILKLDVKIAALAASYSSLAAAERIIQNKMPQSMGCNRDFRYRRNSGATKRTMVDRPAGLFNALTMTVLLNCFLNILMYKCIYIDLTF